MPERKLGVKERGARLEAATRCAKEAGAVGVSNAVDGYDFGLVETRGVVSACRVTGVVIDVHPREPGKEFRLGFSGSPNGAIEQFPKALGMDVLELAIRGVVKRQAQLPSESLLKRQTRVYDFRIGQIELLARELGRSLGPSALHLDATETLLRSRKERPSAVVDDDHTRFVTAVISNQHLRIRQGSDPVVARAAGRDSISTAPPSRSQFNSIAREPRSQ